MITAPDSSELTSLCRELSSRAAALDAAGAWPAEQLQMLGEAGVHRWFLPREFGGYDWTEADLLRGYMQLGSACLTTAFILTQRSGAMRRIVESENDFARRELLPALAAGTTFATVGISHLTTSRRHLAAPVLSAVENDNGYILNGYSPWVTGAAHADVVTLGATTPNGLQVLFALPTSLPGVSAPPPVQLVGLNASHTGPLELKSVQVDRRWLLAGPESNVMAGRGGAKTGGLQTSALAVGLANAAIGFLERESASRQDLAEPAASLREDSAALAADLLSLAEGVEVCTSDDARARANSLALRAAQAALAAAKGTGYVTGHPAGRWCREALFFLVWSCPQGVLNANLCELAGLQDA